MNKLLALTLLNLLLLCSNAYSCTCIGQATMQEDIKSSEAILVGKILSKELVTLTDKVAIEESDIDSLTANQFPYKIVVAKYKVLISYRYKGHLKKEYITVYSGIGNGDCGYQFKIGKEYIIYGNKETYFGQKNNNFPYPKGKDTIWTNNCSRTSLVNNQHIQEIEKYIKPK